MIFIPQQHIFALDRQGYKASFDLDKLSEDLRQAFTANGISDASLANQFALAIEEKLLADAAENRALPENDIDSMTASLLTASGFPEVAADFTRNRGINPLTPMLKQLTAWDENRLKTLLSTKLPLTPALVTLLLPQCQQALQRLSLEQVSDTFIVELALQLLQAKKHTPPEKHLTVAEQRTESSQEPRHDPLPMPQGVQELLDAGILTLCRVTVPFPKAQVALSLEKFLQFFNIPWISELTLASPMHQTAAAAQHLLQTTHTQISQQTPNLADTPATIICEDFSDIMKQQTSSKVQQLKLSRELQQFMTACLIENAPLTLHVIFK